ncbi:MAG: large ribosomal subunit protein uL22 [Bacteroidota bacterium]
METAKKLTRREKIAQGIKKNYEGSKKKHAADQRKAAEKERVFANLKNAPGSPRKYRLITDLVRNQPVNHALAVLKIHNKAAARYVSRLILDAVANWNHKFPEQRAEGDELYIKFITADQSLMLKRIQPAPQGRAYRVRKRYSNIKIELGHINERQADDE